MSVLFLVACDAELAGEPFADLDGYWRGSFISTTDISANGLQCANGGTADLKITNGMLAGTAINTFGTTHDISGRAINQSKVKGSFSRDGIANGVFVGELRDGSLAGTWSDTVGCKGRWTAKRM